MFRQLFPMAALARGANRLSTAQIARNFDSKLLSLGAYRQSLQSVARTASCTALLAIVAMSQAMGQLAHRYSFTASANDSVGTAHGTVVDAGTTTNFTFTGGQLDLTANNGEGSNGIVEDAYVDLPNGIVSAAASAGTSGALAFEWWFTLSEQRTWQRLGDFGSSNDGEDTSGSGSTSDYLSIVANSGRSGNRLDMTNKAASGAQPLEPAVGVTAAQDPNPTALGTPIHVMAVYNHDNHTSFHPAGSNGTMTFYVDGTFVGNGAIHPNFDLTTFNDINNWLGRSQWPDPIFDGSYDEFRIYNAAPSDAYVAASFAAGPNALAAFTPWVEEFDLRLVVDRDTGTFTLSNAAAGSINVSEINISSASGALDPTKWLSVAGNYDTGGDSSFDPDGSWIRIVETANQLQETDLFGDGGQLGPGGALASVQLGGPDAWLLSSYEDLVVTVTRLHPDFSTTVIPVFVDYVGGIGETAAPTDLDIDGDTDADDWVLFAANHFDSFAGMTIAQASLLGDLDGDLDNDYEDFLIFQAGYDAAQGAGALAALIAGVPEPSTFALLSLVGCAALVARHRQAQGCK